MNTLSSMRSALQNDLNVSSNSSLFPTATLTLALNRAYRKAGALVRWPALEDAKKTTTQANQQYYDAPNTWRPESIWRVDVDGDPYGEKPDFSPMDFHDFLDWKDNSDNDNSTAKKWAVQWLRYFLQPTPTVADLVICVWGQLNVTAMEDDDAETIFSYSMVECNEALVLEASAILNRKGEAPDKGEFVSLEAKQILLTSYNRIAKDQSKYAKTQPFLSVPDYYASTFKTTRDTTGNF